MSKKSPQLPAVDCRRGAPLGRPEWANDFSSRCRCFRLRFLDGCYDDGGAYWGSPANVYCCTNGDGVQLFNRAASRKVAKAFFQQNHPQIQWVN